MSNLLKRFFRIILPILPIGIFLLIMALVLNEREKKKSEQEEYEQGQEANRIKEKKISEQNETNAINNLVSKYNIKYNWDTLSYEFSLEFRPFINSGPQLATDVEVLDIFEKDGAVYAFIRIGWSPSFYVEFPISKEQENELISYGNGAFNKCLLVVNITSVQKIKYELASVVREGGENASLVIADSDDFFGKGTIVDIVLIPF